MAGRVTLLVCFLLEEFVVVRCFDLMVCVFLFFEEELVVRVELLGLVVVFGRFTFPGRVVILGCELFPCLVELFSGRFMFPGRVILPGRVVELVDC